MDAIERICYEMLAAYDEESYKKYLQGQNFTEYLKAFFKNCYVDETHIDAKKLNILFALTKATLEEKTLDDINKLDVKPKSLPSNSYYSSFNFKRIKASQIIYSILLNDEYKRERQNLWSDIATNTRGILQWTIESESDWPFEDAPAIIITKLLFGPMPILEPNLPIIMEKMAAAYYLIPESLKHEDTEHVIASFIASAYNVIVEKQLSFVTKEGTEFSDVDDSCFKNFSSTVEVIEEMSLEGFDSVVSSMNIYNRLANLLQMPEPELYFIMLTEEIAEYKDLDKIKADSCKFYLHNPKIKNGFMNNKNMMKDIWTDYTIAKYLKVFKEYIDVLESKREQISGNLEKEIQKNQKLRQDLKKLSAENTELKRTINENNSRKISETVEKTKKEISAVYQNDIQCLSDKIKELEKQLADAKEEELLYEEDRKELAALREFMFQTSADNTSPDSKEEDIATDDIYSLLDGRNVLVAGGHDNWIAAMKKEFPDWHYLGTKASGIKNEHLIDKDVIILFTNYISHSAYYSIISKRKPDAKIIYCNYTNIKKIKEIILNSLI